MDGYCNNCQEGWILDGDNHWKQCNCSFWKAALSRMGPEIASARHVESSPLLTLGTVGGEIVIDRTRDNLFIKGWWSDIASHLFLVFSCKMMNDNLLYPFKIVTDSQIFDVRIGNQSYRAKSKTKRDEVITYNGLDDYIGKDLELVIIRLGFLGYRNQSMPGYLKEALTTRAAYSKPTWVVEEPDSLFGPGHFSYNEDVGDYIANRFDPVDLTQTREGPIIPRGVEGSEVIRGGDGLAVDDDRPAPAKVVMPKERIMAPPKEAPRMDTNDPLLFGNGKKKNGKWGGNR